MNYREHLIRELNFVSNAEIGINLWRPVNDIGWSDGCSIGKDRADQTLRFMKRHQDPTIFVRISEAIMQAGPVGAVETGFLHRMAEILIRA